MTPLAGAAAVAVDAPPRPPPRPPPPPPPPPPKPDAPTSLPRRAIGVAVATTATTTTANVTVRRWMRFAGFTSRSQRAGVDRDETVQQRPHTARLQVGSLLPRGRVVLQLAPLHQHQTQRLGQATALHRLVRNDALGDQPVGAKRTRRLPTTASARVTVRIIYWVPIWWKRKIPRALWSHQALQKTFMCSATVRERCASV